MEAISCLTGGFGWRISWSFGWKKVLAGATARFRWAAGLIGGGFKASVWYKALTKLVVSDHFRSRLNCRKELGKALENPTKSIQQLVDVLPLEGSKTKGLIQNALTGIRT